MLVFVQDFTINIPDNAEKIKSEEAVNVFCIKQGLYFILIQTRIHLHCTLQSSLNPYGSRKYRICHFYHAEGEKTGYYHYNTII